MNPTRVDEDAEGHVVGKDIFLLGHHKSDGQLVTVIMRSADMGLTINYWTVILTFQ